MTLLHPAPISSRKFKPVGKDGFRSGLERAIAEDLNRSGVKFTFESLTIRYDKPTRPSRYTPDFILPNGIVIEAKGFFTSADRQKTLLVKTQHPELDLRFVFSNPQTRISKLSKTTYAMWCDRVGIKYAKGFVPKDWINEAKH